jgi:hypothetical protein
MEEDERRAHGTKNVSERIIIIKQNVPLVFEEGEVVIRTDRILPGPTLAASTVSEGFFCLFFHNSAVDFFLFLLPNIFYIVYARRSSQLGAALGAKKKT